MDNVLAESISSFPVPPSEQLIILTISQLRDTIKEAVQEAIHPLQAEVAEAKVEVEQLQATVARQQTEMADLRAKLASLESQQEQDTTRICLDIAHDRQRLARLERPEKEPQPLQKDRADILKALLAANGGKMLAKEARQKMHLSRSRFSELLATMKEDIELRPYRLKKNQKVLVLK